MALVGYSDSEDSDTEAPKQPLPPKPASKLSSKTATSSKPTFRKVVDSSNPNKIRVNLPALSKIDAPADDISSEAPPSKRPRMGGVFGSLNSSLPTPKRAAGAGGAKRGLGKGLGSGMSLKTGAAPGFSREPVAVQEDVYGGDSKESGGETEAVGEVDVQLSQPQQQEEKPAANNGEANPTRKPMFRPLSVANKKKKRPLSSTPQSQTTAVTGVVAKQAPEPAPQKKKVSLFSLSAEDNSSLPVVPIADDEPETDTNPAWSDPSTYHDPSSTHQQQQQYYQPSQTQASDSSSDPQSLTAIAASLNLPASARRQLLGRHAFRDSSSSASTATAINVINFNTDKEYAANEAFRTSGAADAMPAHNPVRAIAPGKHSLQQLVNAAVTQKDALEESFAQGRRNKKEAGNRYGW